MILSLGRVQLKMSRQPTPKIIPQRYLQSSKQIIPVLEADVPPLKLDEGYVMKTTPELTPTPQTFTSHQHGAL
ncbi:hypothetical protein TNCV_3097211 [Trichonephila clavipes]|uniref:Uncharacterized protein n=1 Tax=Trichonephila clavipes TaxID=2585209 RepID=A0A8X6SE16_TRICX|nr:hypothetical protein TNCV_3097211 [Trichonephila clavipes]